MAKYSTVILCTAALFLAMILQLAAKPRFANRLTGAFIVTAAIGGLLMYGYGFTMTLDNLFLAIIRALLGVCGMFVAKMDYASISAAPGMDTVWAQLLFWIIHLMALYATASAAITTIGAEALQKLRLWLARWGEMNLIYGLSDESLEFGKELLARKGSSVVFVDGTPEPSHVAAATKAGCVLRSDRSAVAAEQRFLKSVGIRGGNRKINLYVLTKDTADGLRFAYAFLDSLKVSGVAPGQTSLVILGREDPATSSLQVLGDRYGYGYVTVFQEAGLAARLLVQTFPPCDSIRFDKDARAEEDFEAVVIGFGHVGQAVLKNLVMNGQFEGSEFRAAVFSPDCETANGYFTSSCEEVLRNYDISFHPFDGRSRQLFDHLRQRGSRTKYVVVCTGSEKVNYEIAEDLIAFFERMGVQVPVYLCSYRGVRRFGVDMGSSKLHRLYQSSVLGASSLDRMAMILNHHYQGENGTTPLADWMKCDYFSRMSCRASADFLCAVLRAAGRTKEETLSGKWIFSEVQLENLSKTEHRRWCAFHYCMGFRPMTDEEFERRGQEYRRQLQQKGKASIRIAKNMEGRTHACLVDWEELDQLSEKEQRFTGKHVNYKMMDTDNVLSVPKLLLARENTEV